MKKSIYILPIANMVIESPIQIGKYILTPSLQVISSETFETNYSLIRNLNKEQLLSILSSSELEENSLLIFEDDYFQSRTIDENSNYINRLAQKADKALDLIRLNENNFGTPEQLPGIPGITTNGFQVIEQINDNNIITINGKIRFMIREGIGLYPNDLSCTIYEDDLYKCLYQDTSEVSNLFKEAIHRVSEAMYMNNLNTSFIYLMSTLEMLASRNYMPFKKVKSKILPFISYSSSQYHNNSMYLKNLSETLRTEIIHNGKSIYDFYESSAEVENLLNSLKSIITEYILNVTKRDIKSFKEIEEYEEKIRKSLGV